MTYSTDFREAVLAYKQKGHTVKQVCETFNITEGTYRNWVIQKQKTGNLNPKKHGPADEKSTPNN